MSCCGGDFHNHGKMNQHEESMNHRTKDPHAHGEGMSHGCAMHEMGKHSLFKYLIGAVILIAGVSLIGLIVQS